MKWLVQCPSYIYTVDVLFNTRYIFTVRGEKKSAEFRTNGLKLISIYIS